ncbi:hypothetical protein HPP92_021089 [Vanilla planifolia]|uniref:DUF7054 domain-containing protein n=1 Tax=Vanilla planifolia TaxID=51239 RepID=A0A835Q0W8_VANPL|nr:hypothetical protein HPP92_021089 [Vanilla planifolia]
MAQQQLQPRTPHRKGFEVVENKERKENGKKRESVRMLISVTVLGSAGPIRLVVREEELVSAVIATALKAYAREGRRPVIGSDLLDFALYLAYDGSRALSLGEPIGSFGSRNFLLCKRQRLVCDEISETYVKDFDKKSAFTGWKAWFNRSLALISSQ